MITRLLGAVRNWADAKTLEQKAVQRTLRSLFVPRWKKKFKPIRLTISRTFVVHFQGVDPDQRVYEEGAGGVLRRVEDKTLIAQVMAVAEARRSKVRELRGIQE